MAGAVSVRFLGSGDAFGSGGRFHTCIFVRSAAVRFLIDCGASSLTALKRFGEDPGEIDAILISHLHGDHFGGLPFVILDAHLVGKRTRPLLIAGPEGTKRRLVDAMEAMFPQSSRVTLRYPLEVVELVPEEARRLGSLTVTPYVVLHPTTGASPLALRIECGGRVIAYSGDTAWTDSLLRVARDADLLIVEAYYFDRANTMHMDYQTLAAHRPDLSAKRIVLTHLGADMLARARSLPDEFAEDGKLIVL